MYRAVTRWTHEHRGLALDVIRTYLGGGLLARGVLFAASANGVEVLAGRDATVAALPDAVAGYVVAAHLVGGAMLTVGLYTRLAALVQIPVLVGAVFFVHLHDGLLSANQSLEFSALVLFLLTVVAVFGADRWSADHRWLSQSASPDREAEV